MGRAEGRAARAGRKGARRARRGPPARVREVRGRDPEGPVRRRSASRSGTTAPTTCSRRSRTVSSRSTCTARSCKGRWSLVPAHMDGKEQNWLLIKRSDDDEVEQAVVQGTYSSASISPMLATLDTRIPHGDELGARGEVRRLPRARVHPRRRVQARLAQRQRPHRPLPRGGEGARQGGQEPERRRRRRDHAGSTRRARRASPSCSRETGRSSSTPSTCSSSTASRTSTSRCTSARRASASCSTAASRRSPTRRSFDDGDALFEVAQQQGLEGIIAKRTDQHVQARQAHARLAEGQDGEQRGVRRRGLHARRRAGARARSARSCSASTRATSCATSGTSAPASTTRRSASCSKLLKPLHRDTPPFPVAPKMPRMRKGDVQWVEPQLVAQVRFGEWTHDDHLRHPSYLGIREDKEAGEVTREQPIAGRDPQGQARATALEPRQAVLAGRGDHEGRPAAATTRRLPTCSSRT